MHPATPRELHIAGKQSCNFEEPPAVEGQYMQRKFIVTPELGRDLGYQVGISLSLN
jgi:hypothetical protein